MIVATIVGTLLRACGDISRYGAWHRLSGDSSPRMRRYFRDSGGGSGHEILFSAHAEVFPPAMWMIRECGSLLRACGGISEMNQLIRNERISSPRMWRYFRFSRTAPGESSLFSAHAEVFPNPENGSATLSGSSPRMRSYFRGQDRPLFYAPLFSAHAEVFPVPTVPGWAS